MLRYLLWLPSWWPVDPVLAQQDVPFDPSWVTELGSIGVLLMVVALMLTERLVTGTVYRRRVDEVHDWQAKYENLARAWRERDALVMERQAGPLLKAARTVEAVPEATATQLDRLEALLARLEPEAGDDR